MGEEPAVTQEAIPGLTQKKLSAKVNLANKCLLITQTMEAADKHEVARLARFPPPCLDMAQLNPSASPWPPPQA